MRGHDELDSGENPAQFKANGALPEWMQMGVRLVDQNYTFHDDLNSVLGRLHQG